MVQLAPYDVSRRTFGMGCPGLPLSWPMFVRRYFVEVILLNAPFFPWCSVVMDAVLDFQCFSFQMRITRESARLFVLFSHPRGLGEIWTALMLYSNTRARRSGNGSGSYCGIGSSRFDSVQIGLGSAKLQAKCCIFGARCPTRSLAFDLPYA